MFSNFSVRSSKILKHIGLNFLYKGGSILISFFFIPLSIRYLGSEGYGIWLTLFSFIAWFNFFDFGLGHGLRNYLTKTLAAENFSLAKRYVSTAYNCIFIFSIILIVIFFFLFDYINWQSIFKVPDYEMSNFLVLIKIVISTFFLNLGLKLVNIIFFASLKPSIPGFIAFINNFITFSIITFLLFIDIKSLVYYGTTIVLVQSIILLTINIIIFSNKYNHLKPDLFYIDKQLARNIFGLGGKFFLIQIAAIVLYSSDNMIITHLFSPEDVTTYNVAYKYFGIITMIATLFLAPMWSAITDANEVGDFLWIRRNIKKAIFLVTGFSFLAIIMFFFASIVYKIWVGNKIIIPELLSFNMMLYVISSIYLQIFSMYLNGVGKIKVQLTIGVLMAIINIPLSIYLSKYINLGLSGIIMATLICNLIPLLTFIIQYNKIISNKAKGIWNE